MNRRRFVLGAAGSAALLLLPTPASALLGRRPLQTRLAPVRHRTLALPSGDHAELRPLAGQVVLVSPNQRRQTLTSPNASHPLWPDSALVDHRGRLLITDTSHGVIFRVQDGRLIPHVSGLTQPRGLAQLPDGTLLVCEPSQARVLRISPAGRRAPLQLGALIHPRAISVDRRGTIWVADPIAGQVVATTPSSTRRYRLPDLPRPRSVLAQPDGAVWIADPTSGAVARLSPDGATTTHRLDDGQHHLMPLGLDRGPAEVAHVWVSQGPRLT